MKLKICGIHDKDILQHACEAGVDFVGFIMANESPRKISDNFFSWGWKTNEKKIKNLGILIKLKNKLNI